MPRDGSSTRQRILDTALELILEKGYAGVSVDRIIEKVGITKGAFFYHFKSKNELAGALIRYFGELDARVNQQAKERAERLSSDPLQRVLIIVGLFIEMFEEMEQPFPGCLFASYTYELQQFDEQTHQYIRETFLGWRRMLKEKLDEVVEKYPPVRPVDTASLADAFTVVLEGAFITAKALGDNKIIGQQLRHYKTYLELLFA